MNYNLILLLAFLQSTLSNCNTAEKNSNISKITWKSSKPHCMNFKCPPVENLLCVRLRAKKIGSKTKDLYMVVFNECELKYIECHPGYQATVVSMKYCGNHEKLSGKLRSKRSVIRDKPRAVPVLYPFGSPLGLKNTVEKKSSKSSESDNSDKNGTVDIDEDNTDIINSEIDKAAAAQAVYDVESGETIPPENRIRINDVRQPKNDKKRDENQNEKIEKDAEEGSVDQRETEKNNEDNQSEAVKAENVKKGDKINVDNKVDNKQEPEKDTDDQGRETESDDDQTEQEKDADGTQRVAGTKGTQSEESTDDIQSEAGIPKTDKQSEVEIDIEESTISGEDPRDTLINGNQIRMMGHLDYDLNAANDGVDFDEYEKDCPLFCPAREVMICARCKDGIYRTFMSVCHLRMFNCAHKEEKSELISRYPCILSAPYLAEAPSPKGRVAEPGDVDLVLHYIRCREKLERNRVDPRCAYILKAENLLPKD